VTSPERVNGTNQSRRRLPTRPPRLAQWLVTHAVPSDIRDDVAGDLSEMFHRDLEDDGAARATARYWRNAISCSIRFGVERCRNLLHGGVMPIGWRMDLMLAARMLVRHPALSAIAVFGITVAIALAATMFTIVGEQLNPPDLPLPQGDRVVALLKWDVARNQPAPIEVQELLTWREELSALRDVGGFRTVTKNLIVPPASPEPIDVAEMSAAGFEVAGISPLIGRVIRADDERAGADPVVVIGYAEWRSRFGANPAVLNTRVQLGGTHHTVVGVMPEGFAFPINHSYWIPLRLDSSSDPLGRPPLSVFARLADDATVPSAHAQLTVIGERARATSARVHQDVRPRVVSYTHQFPEMEDPDNKLGLQLVRFFVAILLIVISINIAVLVYARTAARHAEIALRTALGASRGRIVAQLFGEGLVLAALGAVAGVSIAAVALVEVREALSQQGQALPFWMRMDLSAHTMMYIVALTVTAAAVIGALPAWKATGPKVQSRLQALTAGGGAGMHLGRVWTGLILLQVAIAVALLPMVVVRMSELAREATSHVGFAADEFLVAELSMEQGTGAPTGSADTVARFAKRYREMEQRIAGMGTVRASTFSAFAPGYEASTIVRSDIDSNDVNVDVNRVAANFFDTYGVSVLTGRNFMNADAAPAARVVIVNRSFAELVAGGRAVLGSRVQFADGGNGGQAITALPDDWYEIVGIVEDFLGAPSPPKVYRAITPEASPVLTMTLHLRTGDTEPWGARLPQMAADLDPTLQVTNVTRMGDLLWQQQRTQHLIAGVFAAMTLSVLLLSAAGIYAMTAFAVTQRRREIGIRLALGAGGQRILWAMFSRVGAQLLAGAALGTAVAVLINRAVSGGSISDDAAMAMVAVVLLMTLVGFLAALGPARQGLRIDPTEALRDPVR
jgi:putative ABC transport system permease protein